MRIRSSMRRRLTLARLERCSANNAARVAKGPARIARVVYVSCVVFLRLIMIALPGTYTIHDLMCPRPVPSFGFVKTPSRVLPPAVSTRRARALRPTSAKRRFMAPEQCLKRVQFLLCISQSLRANKQTLSSSLCQDLLCTMSNVRDKIGLDRLFAAVVKLQTRRQLRRQHDGTKG